MSEPSLPQLFGALSDPTRLAIVERLLAEGERSAGEIAEPFAISRPAISKHLRVLEQSGLIERRVDRQWRVCRARPEAIRVLDQWLERYRAFWEGSFDRLDKLFAAGLAKKESH
jgi:DNA-binding transcriptional ArsR family regulator